MNDRIQRVRKNFDDVHPLEPLPTLKLKIGVMVLGAVGVTVFVFWLGLRVQLWPSVAGVIAAVVALLFVRILARGLTTPLREITEAADAMAHGHYDLRVTVRGRGEMAQLAVAFNRMAAELAETDRVRRDLVANVSHELRTPITALQAKLENLVDGVEPPDRDTFAVMLAQVERLGRLVHQLLDLSRLESGVVPLERSHFEIEPLLEHAAKETQLHAPDVSVAVTVEPHNLAADADAERVHQVVANLLENAVRFTPEGGTVEVKATRSRHGVTIEVCDEGPGIPDADLDKVFERFYRADSARSSSGGGAGLGLAIARWIVDLHGGEIRAGRREPHGCRMIVDLPDGSPESPGVPAELAPSH
ncbi:MAG: HAMP domain-containing sensor histidine kinase [Acidimicrobiia bacterium]